MASASTTSLTSSAVPFPVDLVCGYDISEERKNRFNKDIALKEIKILDYGTLLWAASTLKKEKEDTGGHTLAEDNEYCKFLRYSVDAFVALGGGADKSGYVAKNTLISTIKNEFELIFDIDTLMEGLESVDQDRLDYSTFCALFEQDKKTLGRKGSVLSVRRLLR